MKRGRRNPGRAAVLVVMSLAVGACGGSDPETTTPAQPSPQAPTSAAAPAPYPATVPNCGVDYTYAKAPERVVAPSVFGTELMLALGLERRLAGVVGAPGVITPELQPKMVGVNVITERTFPPPGKEVILSANPDFLVSGYSEDFAETAIGDRASLKSAGVNSYLVQGKCGDGKGGRTTLDDTYADVENLGRIFNVRAEAAALTTKLKAEAAAAPPASAKPKVAPCSGSSSAPVRAAPSGSSSPRSASPGCCLPPWSAPGWRSRECQCRPWSATRWPIPTSSESPQERRSAP